jgi:isocitrate/isopropylmalate dehydrogenase
MKIQTKRSSRRRHYRIAVIAGDGIGPESWRKASAFSTPAAVKTIPAKPELRTCDRGGSATTVRCGTAIADAVAG